MIGRDEESGGGKVSLGSGKTISSLDVRLLNTSVSRGYFFSIDKSQLELTNKRLSGNAEVRSINLLKGVK